MAKFHKNDPYIYFYDGGELLRILALKEQLMEFIQMMLGFYEMARKLTQLSNLF